MLCSFTYSFRWGQVRVNTLAFRLGRTRCRLELVPRVVDSAAMKTSVKTFVMIIHFIFYLAELLIGLH
jgi:hypothetical protein